MFQFFRNLLTSTSLFVTLFCGKACLRRAKGFGWSKLELHRDSLPLPQLSNILNLLLLLHLVHPSSHAPHRPPGADSPRSTTSRPCTKPPLVLQLVDSSTPVRFHQCGFSLRRQGQEIQQGRCCTLLLQQLEPAKDSVPVTSRRNQAREVVLEADDRRALRLAGACAGCYGPRTKVLMPAPCWLARRNRRTGHYSCCMTARRMQTVTCTRVRRAALSSLAVFNFGFACRSCSEQDHKGHHHSFEAGPRPSGAVRSPRTFADPRNSLLTLL